MLCTLRNWLKNKVNRDKGNQKAAQRRQNTVPKGSDRLQSGFFKPPEGIIHKRLLRLIILINFSPVDL
jgi:hypothetical protein